MCLFLRRSAGVLQLAGDDGVGIEGDQAFLPR